MRNRLLLSCSAFAMLSLGGCEFFDNYVQDCPPGTVMGHCYDDPDASIQTEHPKAPERPDPTDDDDDQDDDDDDDDDGGCKDPKSY